MGFSSWNSLGSNCLLHNAQVYSDSNRMSIPIVATGGMQVFLCDGGIGWDGCVYFNFLIYFCVRRTQAVK